MVGHKHDDRFLAGILEGLQDLADLVIQIADVREISLTRPFDIVFGDVKAAPVIGVENPFGMHILGVIAQIGHLRQQMVAVVIQIPIFLARHVRVMRVGKADGHAPRAVIKATRQVIDLARCLECDGVVIFHLVAYFGHPCARHRPHVVVPPVNAFAGFAIIGGPAEISGIDISGQTFLEPVQLVGADKMHLARQAGVIARTAQVMRIGRHAGRKFSRVVIDARGARQLARHKRRPPRCAQWAGGIGILEPRRPRCQFFQVRGMQPIDGAIGKQRAVQLVDHQDQDVWFGHRLAPTNVSSSSSACPQACLELPPSDRAARRYRPSIMAAKVSASRSGRAEIGRSAWVRFDRSRA